MNITMYSDGGERGNPGPGAIGIIILNEENEIIEECSDFLGVCTNNQAEYKAVIKGLEIAIKYGDTITCVLDSKLVASQLRGEFVVRNAELLKLFTQVKKNESKFKKVLYKNVPRTNPFIARADALVNNCLDNKA